jgi:hypothetical protein
LANFAFASSWTPGQSDDRDFVDRVIVPVLGDPRHISGAKLRRLMFEAFTLAVSDLRQRVTRTSDDPPQRLSAPERAARMKKLKDRLTGISITEALEPSHKLMDTYVQMYEDDVLRFVPWNELTERSQEVLNVKKDKLQNDHTFAPDANGFMKAKALETDLKANLTSDFRFVCALQRRGLAMEIAGLCQYEVHQEVVDHYLKEFMSAPMVHFRSCSLEQIERADQFLFTRAAEITASGLKRNGIGLLPLEEAIKNIRKETRFLCLTMQLMDIGTVPLSRPFFTLAEGETEVPPKADRVKGGGKGAKGVKGVKKELKGVKMPALLKGMHSKTKDGEPLCFGWNLPTGCPSNVAAGKKCSKGWHFCCFPKCKEPHSLQECKKRISE